ncbi:MAG: hypothetical protein JW864_11100 [Spirochaetes bacterium]|nr:hypothetical protein [Spirochaetota bacterium]
MFRIIIAFFLILITYPAFAGNAPDFSTLKKIWGDFDSAKLYKTVNDNYKFAARKGKISVSRDLHIILPESPELLMWIFYSEHKPENGDSLSPEKIINEMKLKELSSWYNALIVIVDSGESLYAYNPDNGLSEIMVYNGIYEKLVKLNGPLPASFTGFYSGSEAAIKFAPFVTKLYSIVCISGIYEYDSLPSDSMEYKIRIKEYGSAGGWELEQPVKILPHLECSITLLSEEKSIYRKQAQTAAGINGTNKIKFIMDIGEKSDKQDFWKLPEVMKILKREIQSAGGQ